MYYVAQSTFTLGVIGMAGLAFNEQILHGLRPNFFELLSEEAMHEALRPAFQYIIKVRLGQHWETVAVVASLPL